MEAKTLEKKMQIYLYIVIAIFLILVSRLAYMQLIKNDKYSTMARENRMRLITIVAPRGEVFDRNGVKLLGNQPVYTVSLVNLGRKDMGGVVQKLADVLGIDPQEIQQKINQQERSYEPVKIATSVPTEVVTRIEEQRLELPGVTIDIEPQREYPNGNLLAHVMGYIRQINQEQLEENKDKGYKPGDNFGQSGLENTYEQYLRGQDGGRQVEVDATGRAVRDLGVKDPTPGNNLVLTIDQRVQRAAEEALAKASQRALKQGHSEAKGGAAVALDVRSGEVLAMASYPTFDQVKLSGVLTQKDYNEVFNNPRKPVLNRAILPYAPGSTFKMIVAMAGLETGKITPEDAIYDPGTFFLGRTFNDWKPGGHGDHVDMIKALKVSCDTYFYQLGIRVGIDNIARFMGPFGFGSRTGVDIEGESEGVLPSPEWKKRRFKRPEQQKWFAGETISVGIGQGYNAYTPIQLAQAMATLANDGVMFRPHLVKYITDSKTGEKTMIEPQPLRTLPLKPENIATIKHAMVGVNKEGTGARAFAGAGYEVGGKTGTAQVYSLKGSSYNRNTVKKELRDHALFIAFAPADKPKIALAVLVENGGFGAQSAAPIARLVMDYYLLGKLPKGPASEDEKAGEEE